MMNSFLFETARKNPAAIALMNPKGILNYGDFCSITLKTANNFREAGIQAGEKVSLLVENHFEYVVMIFALWEIGAVVVPISSKIPLPQIKQILKFIDCSHITLPKQNSAGKIPEMNTLFIEDFVAHKADSNWKNQFPEEPLSLSQDATIIFTSGTTEMPKAVLHTLGNHYYSALGSNENIPVNEGDRWLLSLPLFHVGGFAILVRSVLGGGAVVMMDLKKSLNDTLPNFTVCFRIKHWWID